MELLDKIVVITGGSRGFGKALAELFIKEGSQVVILSKTKASLEITAQEIGAIPFVTDVRNEEDIQSVARKVVEHFGAIDLWVNCAGVFVIFPKDELIDLDRAHMMFDVNFFGSVFGSRTALSHMKERGGIIVNVLSSAALDATRAKNAELYAASKWALRGYIEALRGENKEGKVQILSIYPGGMKTHLHDEAIPVEFENFMEPLDVAQKVIENLKKNNPKPDLMIKRPMP
jgi:NAD(P)-dependent dehydrogenase (short-subunit alcohol dehydrogenase family)